MLSFAAVYINCCLSYTVCRGLTLCTILMTDKFSKKGKVKVAVYQHCLYCTSPTPERNIAISSFCTAARQSYMVHIHTSPPWLFVLHQLTTREMKLFFSPVCQYAVRGCKRHCLILVSAGYILLGLPQEYYDLFVH